jgi:molybdopterin converting factor small subunit
VTVKIYNYNIFKEGLMHFKIEENTTINDVLNIIISIYGDIYEKKYNRKLFDDFSTLYKIFLNNNYIEIPSMLKQRVQDEDHILILHPISGG